MPTYDCPHCGHGSVLVFPDEPFEFCAACGLATITSDGRRMSMGHVPRKSPFELDELAAQLGLPIPDRSRPADRDPIACADCGHTYFMRNMNEGIDYCGRCGLAHVLLGDKSARIVVVPNRRLDPRFLEARARECLEEMGPQATGSLAEQLKGGRR